jgi:hypothetical protein
VFDKSPLHGVAFDFAGHPTPGGRRVAVSWNLLAWLGHRSLKHRRAGSPAGSPGPLQPSIRNTSAPGHPSLIPGTSASLARKSDKNVNGKLFGTALRLVS